MLRLRVELLEKSQSLGPNHPEIKLLEAKMKAMQKESASVAPEPDEEINAKRYRQGLAIELQKPKKGGSKRSMELAMKPNPKSATSSSRKVRPTVELIIALAKYPSRGKLLVDARGPAA